jgi:hypothetical protein
MAERNTHSSRSKGAGFLAAFTVAAVVLASGCARTANGTVSDRLVSASPSQANSGSLEPITEQPLPLPVPEGGTTLLAVLDPDVVKPEVSAEEAVALIWAETSDIPEETPRVQLVRLAFRDPGSSFSPIWTGWIILYTELPGSGFGGPYLPDLSPMPTVSIVATYTWFYVSPDGEVLGETQVGYETVESVPSLPPEPAN